MESLVNFKQSNIWKDMMNEAGVWLEQIGGQLENPDMALSTRELDRLGGCALGVRNMGLMIDVLIGLVEEDHSGRESAMGNLKMGGK